MEQYVHGNTKLLAFMRKEGLLTEDLTLVDVGCSGGILPLLRVFEPHLAAIAIDPLVTEINRLRSIESNPKVRYFDAWVVSDREPPPTDNPGAGPNWFPRSSAAEGQRLADSGTGEDQE